MHGKYCDAHKQEERAPARRYDDARSKDPILANNARIRSSGRWQKVARMIRARYPLCKDPFGTHAAKGETVSSEQVHHIKGLSEAPELAFLPSNLMAVCCRCHAKLERK